MVVYLVGVGLVMALVLMLALFFLDATVEARQLLVVVVFVKRLRCCCCCCCGVFCYFGEAFVTGQKEQVVNYNSPRLQ